MATKSDFMAAEEIKAILHGRDKNEQERIIRWVSESLVITEASGGRPTSSSTQPQAASSTVQVARSSGPEQRKDIKSFVAQKNPKSDVQFAAVTAYFYRFEASQAERKEVILPQDLQDAGRQARGYGFSKPLVTLNNAVALGYFDRGGRGEFKLNAVGENLVAMTLPSGDSGGRLPRAKKKKPSNIRGKSSKKRKAS